MDWTTVLKTVSPWLGAAIGGPLGSLALSTAADALGLSDKTTDALKQAISNATPEQMLALKTADQKFQLDMQALGFAQIKDLEAIAAGDRASARDMLKATGSNMPATLSFVVTLGYFGILCGMLSGALKVSDSQALLLLLGSLSTSFGMVMAFWFGTTRESGRKTELLAAAPAVK